MIETRQMLRGGTTYDPIHVLLLDSSNSVLGSKIIFKAQDPFNPESWTDAVHFEFEGYDTEPFWDDDGKTYINGAHAWKIGPWIQQAEADLNTGKVGEWRTIWNGTGGMVCDESSGDFLRADMGTGTRRTTYLSKAQRVLSFQVGSPDEANGDQFKLSDTQIYFKMPLGIGSEWRNFPMGRETVMTSVTWNEGKWPYFTPVEGKMSGWEMPLENMDIEGPGYVLHLFPLKKTSANQASPWISLGEIEGDAFDFSPNSTLPAHFTYWRYPIESSYIVSPPEKPNSLRLIPSKLNLTALNGNYAGPDGQTFIGRRQQDTLFSYSVELDFQPTEEEEEAGVTVFLTQNHHLDLGVVLLPASASTQAFPGQNLTTGGNPTDLKLQFRFRAMSYVAVPTDIVAPVPEDWLDKPLRLEIRAVNMTHYSFSAGPAGSAFQTKTLLYASNDAVSWGFTGVFLGVYSTSNGRTGNTPAYISNWNYTPEVQFRD
ncbi:beta-xylosidase [Colletotrichum lupini]|uniref:Beta-xylosidase n=1 Tax=Colletotrichum lupini TaxID=145971 RepID=A0A9Q8TAC4_9PEZI|nr:beta-xylosidase [Colletotrichum lupini]UQC91016.1 beta-xylosidase [Colletotrichum lupini]